MFRPTSYQVTPEGVRLRDIPLSGADPASFRHVVSFWSRDDRSVFWGTSRRTKVDPATFEPLNAIWAKDARAVFTATGKEVHGADLASFRACDAGIDERLADELATRRTLAVALTSREQPRARTVMLRRSHQ